MQDSSYAELLGVPVAVLGLVAYGLILGTALRTSELARVAGAALALGGLGFGLYLVYVQAALIDALCQWCLDGHGAGNSTWLTSPSAERLNCRE